MPGQIQKEKQALQHAPWTLLQTFGQGYCFCCHWKLCITSPFSILSWWNQSKIKEHCDLKWIHVLLILLPDHLSCEQTVFLHQLLNFPFSVKPRPLCSALFGNCKFLLRRFFLSNNNKNKILVLVIWPISMWSLFCSGLDLRGKGEFGGIMILIPFFLVVTLIISTSKRFVWIC